MSLDPITAVLDLGAKVIDKIFPDPAQRDAAKLKMMELQQQGEFKQLDYDFQLALEQAKVNAVEAASGSTFVSGGRPAAMWVCVMGLFYTFIAQPLATWASSIGNVAGPPKIDTDLLVQLLIGMLGLAGIRSWDKTKGVAAK
jgi:hypothetical protein